MPLQEVFARPFESVQLDIDGVGWWIRRSPELVHDVWRTEQRMGVRQACPDKSSCPERAIYFEGLLESGCSDKSTSAHKKYWTYCDVLHASLCPCISYALDSPAGSVESASKKRQQTKDVIAYKISVTILRGSSTSPPCVCVMKILHILPIFSELFWI